MSSDNNDVENPHTEYTIKKEKTTQPLKDSYTESVKTVIQKECSSNKNQDVPLFNEEYNTLKSVNIGNKINNVNFVNITNENKYATTTFGNSKPVLPSQSNSNINSTNPSNSKYTNTPVSNISNNKQTNSGKTSAKNNTYEGGNIAFNMNKHEVMKENTVSSNKPNLAINTNVNYNTGNQIFEKKIIPLSTKTEGNKPKIFQNIQVNMKNATSPKNMGANSLNTMISMNKNSSKPSANKGNK